MICSILDAENSSHFWYGQRLLGSAEINVSRLEYPCVSEMASLGLELGARSRLASAFSVAANTEFVFFFDLPEIDTDLLVIETTALPEIKTALSEIKSALPETENALLKIEILSYEVENSYQSHEVKPTQF